MLSFSLKGSGLTGFLDSGFAGQVSLQLHWVFDDPLKLMCFAPCIEMRTIPITGT